jgi:dCTP deaminase
VTGGILSDGEIRRAVERGDIVIDPFDPARLNPCSYDLTLGNEFTVYDEWIGGGWPRQGDLVLHDMLSPEYPFGPDGPDALQPRGCEIDIKEEPKMIHFRFESSQGLRLNPGIGYLMHTVERITTKKYVPVLDGKSSVGRLFMKVHETAGYGDPGFDGQYTLEVTVVQPLRVYPGMRIAQMRFHTIVGEVEKPYAGNYTGEGARGPVGSRAWRQFVDPNEGNEECVCGFPRISHSPYGTGCERFELKKR